MHRHVRTIIVAGLIAAVAAAGAGAAGPGPTYAIRNARIVPVSGPAIEKGILVIRDGLIAAVGPADKIAVPEDAEIVEADGLTAYPGLISAHTHLLLDDPAASSGQRGEAANPPALLAPALRGAAAAAEASPRTPELMILERLKPAKAALDGYLKAGFTTVLIAPRAGILQGQSVIVNLNGLETGSMVVRTPAALHVNFATNRGGYPSSLMGTIAFIRQSFLDAGHYALARDVYAKNLMGMKRPVYDPVLEALIPFVRDKEPVVFQCNNVEDLKRALKIIDEFRLNGILSQANEAWRAAAALKKAGRPLLVTLDFRPPNGSFYTSQGEDLRKSAEAELYPGNPAALAKEGIPFALTTLGLADAAAALKNLRTALKLGLSEDAALRALTLVPARFFGLDRQLGSLEPGKIANVVLAKGPLFEEKSQIDKVFVDGVPWTF